MSKTTPTYTELKDSLDNLMAITAALLIRTGGSMYLSKAEFSEAQGIKVLGRMIDDHTLLVEMDYENMTEIEAEAPPEP
jgi:hypothetical protein